VLKLLKPLNKGDIMAVLMAKVGSEFTSQKSGHTGIIAEIINNPDGTYRVRFEDGRWTTVS
jgi:hypothetical protein